ncbi:MAG TPA: hypothetical protein VMS63_07155 [Gaiellaceae bacterium]|nr:hypothetical protein [Gaiellaceae bacterium]
MTTTMHHASLVQAAAVLAHRRRRRQEASGVWQPRGSGARHRDRMATSTKG